MNTLKKGRNLRGCIQRKHQNEGEKGRGDKVCTRYVVSILSYFLCFDRQILLDSVHFGRHIFCKTCLENYFGHVSFCHISYVSIDKNCSILFISVDTFFAKLVLKTILVMLGTILAKRFFSFIIASLLHLYVMAFLKLVLRKETELSQKRKGPYILKIILLVRNLETKNLLPVHNKREQTYTVSIPCTIPNYKSMI